MNNTNSIHCDECHGEDVECASCKVSKDEGVRLPALFFAVDYDAGVLTMGNWNSGGDKKIAETILERNHPLCDRVECFIPAQAVKDLIAEFREKYPKISAEWLAGAIEQLIAGYEGK